MRNGRGKLTPIEEAEIGPVDGLRILHLQCHFGRDTLTLAQRGVTAVGLDFSVPAIAAARALSTELGITDRAHFIEAELYDARQATAGRARLDEATSVTGRHINDNVSHFAARIRFLIPRPVARIIGYLTDYHWRRSARECGYHGR